MKRPLIYVPILALVAFAGYLGLKFGQTPSETEVINRYAAIYLRIAPEGARATDCAAATHPDPAVRMVITCFHPNGVETTFFTGPRGEALSPINPEGPAA